MSNAQILIFKKTNEKQRKKKDSHVFIKITKSLYRISIRHLRLQTTIYSLLFEIYDDRVAVSLAFNKTSR